MKFAPRQQPTERRRPRPRRLYGVLSPIEDAEESPFEPHRDVPLRMQEDMLRYVRGDTSMQVEEESYLDVAARAITMFPEMRQDLKLERQRDSRITRYNERIRKNSSDVISSNGGLDLLITCYPEAKQQLPVDTIKTTLISLFNEERDGNMWFEASDAAVLLLMIDPESRDKLLLDEKMREGLLAEVQKDRNEKRGFSLFILRNFALLFPDHKDELPLTTEFWDTMKNFFTGRNRTSRNAEAMTILAAKRAEIGSDGLIHITPHQPKLKKSTPLPHRKRS